MVGDDQVIGWQKIAERDGRRDENGPRPFWGPKKAFSTAIPVVRKECWASILCFCCSVGLTCIKRAFKILFSKFQITLHLDFQQFSSAGMQRLRPWTLFCRGFFGYFRGGNSPCNSSRGKYHGFVFWGKFFDFFLLCCLFQRGLSCRGRKAAEVHDFVRQWRSVGTQVLSPSL